MDVERIQKVNNLALDLIKQGLASDREDAIQQAEKIFSNDSGTARYNEMKETLVKVETTKKEKYAEYTGENPEETSTENPSSTVMDMDSSSVKKILQQNTNFVVKKFKEIQEKIDSLEREIAGLRTKMSYERLPTVKELVDEAAEKQQVKQEVPAEAPKPEITESEAPPVSQPVKDDSPKGAGKDDNHPRSGNFNNTDVSIEKFFYMGNKS